ncbi:MAG: ATP synthase F0 subunit C [Verrucomicrobiota bacterium]
MELFDILMPLLAAGEDSLPLINKWVAVALVGFGAAIGVGMVGSKAAEAVGRNPSAFGSIFVLALIGMALAEGLAILTFFLVTAN